MSELSKSQGLGGKSCYDSSKQEDGDKLLVSGTVTYPSYLDKNQYSKSPGHELQNSLAREQRTINKLIKKNKKREHHVEEYLALESNKVPYLSNKNYFPDMPVPLNYMRAMKSYKEQSKDTGNKYFRGKELHLPGSPNNFPNISNLTIKEINVSNAGQSTLTNLHQTRLYKNRIGKYMEMKKRNKTKDYINKRIEANLTGMRREYLAGSTNFETFMGHNEFTDTKEVGRNSRQVFDDSDALMNSQADNPTIKGNFTGQARLKVELASPKVTLKRPEIFITNIDEADEDQDSESQSFEEKSVDLISKIQ